MINAKDARRKSLLQSVGIEAMKVIEKAILYAIAFGKTTTELDADGLDKEVINDIIIPELKELGYIVEYRIAKPIPVGCPSDQWYSRDELIISWGEEVNDD